MATATIDLGIDGFHELRDWCGDDELITLAAACIEAQRREAVTAFETTFRPAPAEAEAAVSDEALRAILATGRDVHGVATQRSISNVIAFNARKLPGAVNSRDVAALRARVDARVADKLRALAADRRIEVVPSGHFWYPPGAYMGWHTNSEAPGIRIYVTHAEEPGRSFFRYREPASGRVVTALDDRWNVRLFRVSAQTPFWHAVYSDTNRFSLGYLVRRGDLGARLGRVLGRLRR